MTKIKKVAIFILAIVMVCGVLTGCKPPAPAVSKISIVSEPTKTNYYIDEEFSAAGGKIKVFYDDNTEKELDMTAEGVTFDPPVDTSKGEDYELNEDEKWERTATVKFGGKKETFNIYVSYEKFTITFDYKYDGKKETKVVRKKDPVAEPAEPKIGAKREDGWEFNGWYTNEQYGDLYKFSAPVMTDLTLYAEWLDPSLPKVVITYNLAYYGVAGRITTKTASYGSRVVPPSVEPRVDYKHLGWFTAETGGEKYDFTTTPVRQDMTLYAQWEKTKTGVSTYVFETENLTLNGKSGPGISGVGVGRGMLVADTQSKGASGGMYLSFLYADFQSTEIEFDIACDEAVSDAIIILRLSAEVQSWTMTNEIYKVFMGGTELMYSPINFSNVPPMVTADTPGMLDFKDYTIAINVTLGKGQNTLILKTSNTWDYPGTTMMSHAPLVDCLKITTSAVVTWDANFDVPFYD